MNLQRNLALAALSLVLAACTPSSEPGVFETTAAAKNAAGETPGEFATGEEISLAMTSANLTDQSQTVEWCSGARYDFLVYADGGSLVWNFNHDMLFTQALQSDVWDPLEERSGSRTWSQVDNDGNAVPPGAYYYVVDGCAYHNGERITGFRSDPVDFVIRAP